MAVIHLDGERYEVAGSDNLLQKCLSLGLDLPYFCWHPSLGSVGSCRQCAVKQYGSEEDMAAGKGKIVMSCMVETNSDLYISIDDEEATAFRARITEFLMTNHPHDCPTCEEGGHCHLQDMTVMTGHDRREYRFTKRTHQNQYLGPFINHEMNRCIACYRCTRYYNDYAGGGDLGTFASSNRVYFGRAKDGVLESEFAGNLTEICPTGVFTDKPHSEHYTRKWDMQYAPSICHGCSMGCNISLGERYGEIRRVENRYNQEINGYFLCDSGRFGYDQMGSATRLNKPYMRSAGELEVLSTDSSIDNLAALITAARSTGAEVVGIGSPRASLETNHALKKLTGKRFNTGMRASEIDFAALSAQVLKDQEIVVPTLQQVEEADVVLIIGEDITQTAPRLALNVRQAAKNDAVDKTRGMKIPPWLAEPRARIGAGQNSPIYIIDTQTTRLDDISKVSAVSSVSEMIQFSGSIADYLADPKKEAASGQEKLALEISKKLASAKKPLIISGFSQNNLDLVKQSVRLAKQLTRIRMGSETLNQDTHTNSMLLLVGSEVNSLGTALMGGQTLDHLVAQTDPIDLLIIAENDLSMRLSQEQIETLIKRAKTTMVLDWTNLPWHIHADYLLPAGSQAESDGTVVSYEGRAQRYFQVYEPSYYKPDAELVESWRWLHAIQSTVSRSGTSWLVVDDVIDEIVTSYPELALIKDAAPSDDYRIKGLKIAREPRRYSGRTSMRSPISVHEPRQPVDADSALTFSMEGYVGAQTSSALIPFAWAPGWNSPQSWNKFQSEVGGALKQGESGVRLFASNQAIELSQPVLQNAQASVGAQWIASHHLFSTSDWATRSAVLKERAGEVVIRLSADLANEWGLSDEGSAQLKTQKKTYSVTVAVDPNLMSGTVLYPANLLPQVRYEGDLSHVSISRGSPVATQES